MPGRPDLRRLAAASACLLVAVLAWAGCGGGDGARELRLGYFPNVTHGPALVGIQRGVFTSRITAMPVRTVKFATGTEAVAAMLSGSLDASYMGMGPVITTLSRAPGSLRVLAGAGEGGAVLVVRRGTGIRSVADLRGRDVGFPGFGNTQDITLRLVLNAAGIGTSRANPQVRLVRIRNADLNTAFQRGALDAALVPEPWGTLLVQAGLADVLLRSDQILGGHYPTTVLVVRSDFARRHPEAVRQLVAANAEVVRMAGDPGAVADAFTAVVGSSKLSRDVLIGAARANAPTTRIDRRGTEALWRSARRAGYLGDPVPLDALFPQG